MIPKPYLKQPVALPDQQIGKGRMKRLIIGLLVLLTPVIHAYAVGEFRAVKIDAFSDGSAIDSEALAEVRRILGSAIADGTVDTFIVHSHGLSGPIPIEGGLSACAQAGLNPDLVNFNAFVEQLRFINPLPGTTLNFELVPSCAQETEPESCGGIAGIQCPCNGTCVDDPRDDCDPLNGGADCSGICKPNT